MLDPYSRSLAGLQTEFDGFERLMRPRTGLRERDHILPLFRRSVHLAAYLGYANNNLVLPNLLGIERELLAFRCDIAVGDSRTGQFTLVELEDASAESIFRPLSRTRAFPQWSSRYEAGFSQLVDWAWRIEQERQPSVTLQPIFGTTNLRIHYLLVIGRDHWLDDAAGARLDWRRRHNGIQGELTTIWTYDYFLGFVQRRMAEVRAASGPIPS
jgi:hypothetical protein